LTSQVFIFEETTDLLSLVAKVLSKGLSYDQRKTILNGYSWDNDIKEVSDESIILAEFLNKYTKQKDLSFIIDIFKKIENKKTFYSDVKIDMDKIRKLMEDYYKKKNEKPYVFIMMPFQNEHFIVFEKVIKPTLEKFGILCEHSREMMFADRIIDTVIEKIKLSSFLIADTTGKNANVFYELGYAHALNKKVILITQNINDIPFNINSLRHIQYKLDSLHVLAYELEKFIINLL
jgi:hypothetical protein